MNMKKKINDWSLTKSTAEIQGGEILKYIGSEVLYVKFTKNKETNDWETSINPTFIESIGDYDPMTGTYLAKHKLMKEGTLVEERIMSAGFKWGNPEESGETSRLVPYSLHYKMAEESTYRTRLKECFDNNKNVLGLEQIEHMVGKNAIEGLNNILWIAAVIDSDTENGCKSGLLSFRITGVTNIAKRSRSWSISLKDEKGDLVIIPKFQEINGVWMAKDFSYNGEIVGDLKIMDIETPKQL